jgi:hypothetical protein
MTGGVGDEDRHGFVIDAPGEMKVPADALRSARECTQLRSAYDWQCIGAELTLKSRSLFDFSRDSIEFGFLDLFAPTQDVNFSTKLGHGSPQFGRRGREFCVLE